MYPIRAILHPTDFSDCARHAFHLAAALARAQGARLIVLHVRQTLGPLVAYGETLAQLEPVEYRDKLLEVLHHIQAPDPGVQVEHRLVEGDAAEEILRTAKEAGCDLIVMGTHGRTGMSRMLMGSIAEKVLHKAPCAVVAVKVPRRTFSAAEPVLAGSLKEAKAP